MLVSLPILHCFGEKEQKVKNRSFRQERAEKSGKDTFLPVLAGFQREIYPLFFTFLLKTVRNVLILSLFPAGLMGIHRFILFSSLSAGMTDLSLFFNFPAGFMGFRILPFSLFCSFLLVFAEEGGEL